MKAPRVQVRRTSGAITKPQPEIRPTKTRRVGAGNHVHLSRSARRGGAELQAERAALGYLEGRPSLEFELTTSPPARFSLPASAGESIEARTREPLEQYFGADLAPVRVHRDVPAQFAVDQYSARALTVGERIFFAKGEYQPGTISGDALLAHEVAHVVQQAGRRGSGGGIQIAGTSGRAPPQQQSDPSTTTVSPNVAYTRLRDAYLGKYKTPSFAKFVEQIGKRLEHRLPKPGHQIHHRLAYDSRQGAFRRNSRIERSFVYDCLKTAGLIDGALQMLLSYPDLESLTYDEQLAQKLKETIEEKGDHKWVGKAGHRQRTAVKAYWPKPFIQRWLTLLSYPLAVSKAIPGLDTAHSEFIKNAKTRTEPGPSEAAAEVLRLLAELDKEQLKLLEETREVAKAERTHVRPLVPAETIRQYANANTQEKYLNSRLLGVMWKSCLPRANRVRSLFKTFDHRSSGLARLLDAQRLAAVLASEGRAEALFTPLEILTESEQTKAAIASVERRLGAVVGTFYTASTSPSNSRAARARYSRSRSAYLKALRTGLVKSLRPISDKLIRDFIRKRPGANPTLATSMGTLTYFLSAHEVLLRKLGTKGDERLGSGLQTARLLLPISIALKWKRIQRLSLRAITAPDETKDKLALLGDWKPKYAKSANVRIREDKFDDEISQVPNFGGLNEYDIIILHRLAAVEKQSQILEGKLPGIQSRLRGKRGVNRRQSLTLSSSAKHALEATLFQRYSMLDFEITLRRHVGKASAKVSKRSNALALLAGSQKTQDLLKKVKGATPERTLIGRAEWPVHSRVTPYLWSVWSLRSLKDFALNSRLVRGLIAKNEKLPDSAVVTWEQVVGMLRASRGKTSGTQDVHSSAHEIPFVRKQLRLASSLRRVWRTEQLLKPLVGRYNQRKPLTRKYLERAQTSYRNLAKEVQPTSDGRAQVGVMALDSAEALSKAFSGKSDRTIVLGFLGLVEAGTAVGLKPEIVGEILLDHELPRSEVERVGPAKNWVAPRLKRLEQLEKEFHTTRTKVQKRTGFEAIPGKGVKPGIYKSYLVKQTDPFTVDGVGYAGLIVHTHFSYHPHFGSIPKDGVSKDPFSAYAPPILLLSNGQPVKVGTKLLDIYKGNKSKKVVWDGKYKTIVLLSHLNHAFSMQGFFLSMENLKNVLEVFQSLLLDALTLIPGLGAGILAARVAAAISQVLMERESIEEILQLLQKDPAEIFDDVVEELGDALQPDRLWDYLVFGGRSFSRSSSKSTPRKKPKPKRRRPGKFAALGRLLGSIKQTGARIALTFFAAQERVSAQFAAARGFVIVRPALAATLSRAGHALTTGSVGSQLQAASSKLEDVGDMNKVLANVINGLNGVEVPKDVVPLQPIVAMALGIVMDLSLRKVGIFGKVAAGILKHTGANNKLAELIEGWLKSKGADPNKVWQSKKYRGAIQEKVETARQEFIATLFAQLTATPGLEGLEPPKGKMKFADTPSIEVDGFKVEWPGSDPGSQRAQVPVNGERLSSSARVNAESRFKHDFGHVRLSRDPQSWGLSTSTSIQGLTSGSHVFLNPQVDVQSARGRMILDHELTHVLQHAGSRPLGGEHSDSPRSGRPSSGIGPRTDREQEAERVVAEVRHRDSGEPVRIDQHGDDGLDAAGPKFLGRFLLGMSSLSQAEKFEKVVETKNRPSGLGPDIDTKARAEWGLVWKGFLSTDPHDRHFTKSFESVKKEIVAYLRDQLKGLGKSTTLLQLAKRAQTRKPRKGKPKGSPPEYDYALNTGRLAKLLQGYILAETGVAMSIKLMPRSAEWKVRFLYMPVVTSNPLWSELFKNIWGAAGGTPSQRRATRIFLLERKLDPTLYETGFKLRGIYKTKIKKSLTQFDSEDLPPWKDYVRARSTGGGNQVGLRRGTHTQVKKMGGKKVDRESHHTTQKLLAHYFVNQASTHPFAPVKKKAYRDLMDKLGFDFKGTSIESFEMKGKPELKLGNMARNGGGAMPAVLLARSTHQTKGLHVTPMSDDSPDRVSQASAVHSIFKPVVNELSVVPGTSETKKLDALKADSKKIKSLQKKLYKGMQSTYKWMHGEMHRGLKSILPSEESAYYRGIALESSKAVSKSNKSKLIKKYQPQESQLKGIVESIRKGDKKTMKTKFGFDTKEA